MMVNLARRLVFVGMFFLPLLKLRLLSGLSISDGIFALAAVVLLLSGRRPSVKKSPAWTLGSFLAAIGGITASYFAIGPAVCSTPPIGSEQARTQKSSSQVPFFLPGSSSIHATLRSISTR